MPFVLLTELLTENLGSLRDLKADHLLKVLKRPVVGQKPGVVRSTGRVGWTTPKAKLGAATNKFQQDDYDRKKVSFSDKKSDLEREALSRGITNKSKLVDLGVIDSTRNFTKYRDSDDINYGKWSSVRGIVFYINGKAALFAAGEYELQLYDFTRALHGNKKVKASWDFSMAPEIAEKLRVAESNHDGDLITLENLFTMIEALFSNARTITAKAILEDSDSAKKAKSRQLAALPAEKFTGKDSLLERLKKFKIEKGADGKDIIQQVKKLIAEELDEIMYRGFVFKLKNKNKAETGAYKLLDGGQIYFEFESEEQIDASHRKIATLTFYLTLNRKTFTLEPVDILVTERKRSKFGSSNYSKYGTISTQLGREVANKEAFAEREGNAIKHIYEFDVFKYKTENDIVKALLTELKSHLEGRGRYVEGGISKMFDRIIAWYRAAGHNYSAFKVIKKTIDSLQHGD